MGLWVARKDSCDRWNLRDNSKGSRHSSQGSEPKPVRSCSQQGVGPWEALGYAYWMSTGGMEGKGQMAKK